jgi:hypothetical protein
VDSSKLIVDTLKFVRRLDADQLAALKRFNYAKHLKSPGAWKAISSSTLNQWLQYRYGFRQLYYDVDSAAKAINRKNKKSRTRFTRSKTFTSSGDDTYTRSHFGQWDANINCYRVITYQLSAGVLVDPFQDSVGFNRAFGLDQIFSAGWELTKFSFVADWFLNIGDKIAAFSPNLSQRTLCTWTKSIITERIVHNISSCAVTPRTYSPGYTNDVINFSGTWESEVVTTTRYANPSVNPIPNWNVRFSVGKLVDSVALARQLLSGMRSNTLRV